MFRLWEKNIRTKNSPAKNVPAKNYPANNYPGKNPPRTKNLCDNYPIFFFNQNSEYEVHQVDPKDSGTKNFSKLPLKEEIVGVTQMWQV
jgi:hypothetical protein